MFRNLTHDVQAMWAALAEQRVMRAVARSNEVVSEENRRKLAAGCPRCGADLVDDGHGGVCPVWGCGR